MAQVNHGYPTQTHESQLMYRNNCTYTYRRPGIAASPLATCSVADMEAFQRSYNSRDACSHHGRRGVVPPEQVSRGEETRSWEYNNAVAEEAGHEDAAAVCTTVEMFVPFCSEKNVRDVVHKLEGLPGVEKVTADQWEKKVEVRGSNLSPHALLRVAQINHKYRSASVLWSDRQSC